MNCATISTPGGGLAIVCARGRGNTKCRWCVRKATLLCDAPVRRGGHNATCDVDMCAACSTRMPDGKDFCPPHAPPKAKKMAAS